MELKSLLFIAGTVLAVGVQAQVGTAQSEPLTAVIQPRLQAVQTKNVMANGTLTTVISRNKVRPVAPILAKSGQENSGKLRLDSIIQTDVYGTGYATRQLFEYNDAGKESKRGIYYWDSVSNSWGEPTETYDYEWNEDGLIVSQQGLSGGQGVRYEYKYNEQGLGIEQLTQQLDESGQWVNVSKGVYGYDDRGNMTDEMIINCSKWFHKYNIPQLTYNIIGLPHEDIHKALKTIKLNARIKSDRTIPNIFYPYPGTQLYETAKEAGFLPDVISPDCRVPLVQPQFPEHEVLFIEAYFMHFVKRYRWAFAMPAPLGRIYERWLDFRVTSRFVPHKFYVWLHDIYKYLRNKLKDFLVDHLPRVYIKLRRIKHGIKD